MSRRFRSSSSRRGFTLMEAMVSLTLLVIVMVVTLSLLFSMRSFAERTSIRLAPRQTSRQAIDYLGFYVEGASDLNNRNPTPGRSNPNALVTWMYTTTNNPNQVTYNNLTAAQAALGFGDEGTDLITLATPANSWSVPVSVWPGNQHAANLDFLYSDGCPDDTANLLMFEQLTGAQDAGTNAAKSPILTLTDSQGTWVYYQITSYQGSSCSNLGGTNKIIHVVQTSGQSAVNIPSGHPELVSPIYLMAGVRYVSFRVKGRNLQQKQGFFDPANPDAGFSTIVEDVEDLQVAYLYRAAPAAADVYTYNACAEWDPTTPTTCTLPYSILPYSIAGGAKYDYGVPPQAGLNGLEPVTAWDITNVQGLRISISSRSKELRFTSKQLSQRIAATINNFRPAVEDHAKALTVDGFDHYRVTTTLMIRNRMLGN